MHDKGIYDAIGTGNHNEGAIQDVSHKPPVEDNGTFGQQMSEAGHQSSSSSKKLKSFHLKMGRQSNIPCNMEMHRLGCSKKLQRWS